MAGSQATADLNRFLVTGCGATPHLVFAFMSKGKVLANSLDLFRLFTYSAFCALQSRAHEIWARFFGSSMKDDLRYTPSDCFETFPFPDGWRVRADLEASGKACYEFRAALMIRKDAGLTKIYNIFNSPDEDDPDIIRLRQLHDAMDRAVLDAYGWTDIQPKCEFIPEFDDEDEDDEGGRPRRKKYRYRWPDEIRDEVLARLLELNRQRALEEGQMLVAEPPRNNAKKKRAPKSGNNSKAVSAAALFSAEPGEE